MDNEMIMRIIENVLSLVIAGIVILLISKLFQNKKENNLVAKRYSERKRGIYLPLKRELVELEQQKYSDGLKLVAPRLKDMMIDGDEKVVNKEIFQLAEKLNQEIKLFNTIDIEPIAKQILSDHFRQKYVEFMGTDTDVFDVTNHETGTVNQVEKEAVMITAFNEYLESNPNLVEELLNSKTDSNDKLNDILDSLNIGLEEYETYQDDIANYIDQHELSNTEYIFHNFDLKSEMLKSSTLTEKEEQFKKIHSDVSKLKDLVTSSIESITKKYEVE